MVYLTETLEFPDVSKATQDGLLAVGGDLSSERLKLAYQLGIFPWFDTDDLILWWSPDPRFVLFPEDFKINKSTRQVHRNAGFKIILNQNFEDVIDACKKMKRKGKSSTWITPNMKKAYCHLHELGYAKSVEVWQEQTLVGGLYGVDLNNGVFCGESMFSHVSNASKLALIALIELGEYHLIDCQVYTEHLANFGAKNIPRDQFIKLLNKQN